MQEIYSNTSKNIAKKKVALLMSGGVDSSYSAYLLQQKYEVFGIYLKLHSNEKKHKFFISKCQKVAKNLGIDFHIIDLQDAFKQKVYDYFVRSYKNAQTPNPCAMCNPNIKFGLALEYAISLGADFISSGHYARIAHINGRNYIREAYDKGKDQSYFLFGISQFAKDRLIFPLGEMLKEQVKKEAFAAMPWFGELEEYRDSQEICFVEKSYIDTIANEVEVAKQGIIRDKNGNAIGTHKGYMQYTIGKRKGLDIPLSQSAQFVVEINARDNELIVGDKADLLRTEIIAESLEACGLSDLDEGEYNIKIRYKSAPVKARLKFSGAKIHARVENGVFGVANGQGLVVYRDDVVMGGGFIIESR